MCVSLLICLAVLGSAYAQMPDEASHHVSNAESLRMSGQWDAALREYRAAAPWLPMTPETHFLLGIALYKQRLFDQAVQELTLSVRLGFIRQEFIRQTRLGLWMRSFLRVEGELALPLICDDRLAGSSLL